MHFFVFFYTLSRLSRANIEHFSNRVILLTFRMRILHILKSKSEQRVRLRTLSARAVPERQTSSPRAAHPPGGFCFAGRAFTR